MAAHHRGARTDEALEQLHRLWRDDEVTYRGSYFTLDRRRHRPRPAASPPRWVGLAFVTPPEPILEFHTR